MRGCGAGTQKRSRIWVRLGACVFLSCVFFCCYSLRTMHTLWKINSSAKFRSSRSGSASPWTTLSQTGSINLIVVAAESIVNKQVGGAAVGSGNFFLLYSRNTNYLLIATVARQRNFSFMPRMESFSLQEVVTPYLESLGTSSRNDCQARVKWRENHQEQRKFWREIWQFICYLYEYIYEINERPQ